MRQKLNLAISQVVYKIQAILRRLPAPVRPFAYLLPVMLVVGVIGAALLVMHHKTPSAASHKPGATKSSTSPNAATNGKSASGNKGNKKSSLKKVAKGSSTSAAGGSAKASAPKIPPKHTTKPPAGSGSNVKPTIVDHELETGSTGTRLKMRGVAVWGIEDQITGTFGVSEYNSRQTIVDTIKAWGGNEIRLRVLASDFNNQTYLSQQQELQEIKNWQATAQAAGLYLGVTWWDSLDGPYNDANWASDYTQAFPMMTDVVKTLGAANPWVFYEPFNEPNNVTGSQWLAAMEATVHTFRADGYSGILLIDTDGWSHDYDGSRMSSLENYDAGQSGMAGRNQIIFAKHDYANEFPSPASGFNSGYWPSNDNGTSAWNFSAHLVWETEFGNYNGSPSSVSYPWSLGAASWMAAQINNGTLAGASAFVFGPWYDANALTGSDNSAPTQWGGYVKNNFLGGI